MNKDVTILGQTKKSEETRERGKIDLKRGYEDIEPLGDYILVEVTTKDNFVEAKNGLLVARDETDVMPCLEVLKVSKQLTNNGYWTEVKPGDIVEIADVPRLTKTWGPNLEQFALVDKKYIAAVYSKKE